ncbi:MAG: SRPBCC family protein [Dehalococcoidia bacterium]
MTLQQARPNEFLSYVDKDSATVDRRIFTDQAIYEMELERIFARAWNFMCHESQIPNPGDFFATTIGEDRVLCVRDNQGNAQVLVNSCRHRGNAVCRAEEGHASSFMCTYHGWTFDLEGKLVGVPGFKEVYHEELDRENWGLIKAAKVDSFKGFIFANMDPAAPELSDYLGEVGRMTINTLALHGDNEIVGGVQKYTIPTNWKFAVDNIWDYYHGITSHASAYLTDLKRNASQWDTRGRYRARHLVFLGEYGHAYSGPANDSEQRRKAAEANPELETDWRSKPEALAEMGKIGIQGAGHAFTFPNFWISGNQVIMRYPRGPHKTECWFFTLLDKNLSEDKRKAAIHKAKHTFGPAGLWEQDDGENWGESTRAMDGIVSQRFPLHYGMSRGHGQVIREEGAPPYIEAKINEHSQLWYYRAWSEWMASDSWDDLREGHSKVEGTM